MSARKTVFFFLAGVLVGSAVAVAAAIGQCRCKLVQVTKTNGQEICPQFTCEAEGGSGENTVLNVTPRNGETPNCAHKKEFQ